MALNSHNFNCGKFEEQSSYMYLNKACEESFHRMKMAKMESKMQGSGFRTLFMAN